MRLLRLHAKPSASAAPTRNVKVFTDYESAVKAGKANPAYQGAMGFNLLHNSRTKAYRAAPVGIVPQDGWEYHQRHHKNGLGQWQIRTMSRYGEVHL